MPENQLIGYNGAYWRLINSFSYTGTDQPFTLPIGKYLFVCKGGKTICRTNNVQSINYGGTSYGILDLSEQTTFHAIVGGDVDNEIAGGFNGGANGGNSFGSNYAKGIGGAGATDVRLLPYNQNEYPTYDSENDLIGPVLEKTIYHDTEYDESLPTSSEHTYFAVEYIRSYYNSGYIDTGFQDTNDSRIQVDVSFEYTTANTYAVLMGCQPGADAESGGLSFYIKNNTNGPMFYRGDGSTAKSASFNITFGERTLIDITHHHVSINVGESEIVSFDVGDENSVWIPSGVGVSINSILRGGGNSRQDDRPIPMMLYGFKGYNNNVLESDLVPVTRKSDGWCGLFNKVDNTFHPVSADTSTSYWIAGPPKASAPSLNSRIIVAGGAGGTSILASYSNNFNSMTAYGGLTGGYVNTAGPQSSYNLTAHMFASQTKGHAFGYGGQASTMLSNKSYSAEGCGGGGGGWYGGFSAYYRQDAENQTTNGGGGSSYVLTESSYKPPDYNPSSKYYMTDVRMTASDALESGVYIYEETLLRNGDIIEFPCIGVGEHMMIPSGKYKFQCYGGNGGSRRRWFETSNGGYSEGIFTTLQDRNIHVYVGGSGGPAHVILNHFGDVDTGHTNSTFSTSAFNGGHKTLLNLSINSTNSGGGTDIRIDDDDLYNRIIVAGGGGSQGGFTQNTLTPTYVGGAGGGLVGDSPTSGNGTNYGGGTQTESPSGSYDVYGSFGEGGGVQYASSSIPGSGGGGWFGGSGTSYSSSSDTGKGGAGGSGFVLTADTELISGYKLTHEDALTNASTVVGGNTLGPNTSKAVITVQDIYAKLLCQDDEGYKYYNSEHDSWTLLPSQRLIPAAFEEYGNSLTTDNGLVGKTFKVYAYDISESTAVVSITVVPSRQFIYANTNLELDITGLTLDDKKYKDDEYDVSCSAVKKRDPETGRMMSNVQLAVDKLTDVNNYYRAYGARILYNGSQDSHEYLKLDENGRRIFKHYITNDESGELVIEERTMELEDPEKYRDPITKEITVHQSLLRVGIGNRIPIKYLNILDQDVGSIHSIVFAECDRVVYMLALVKINNAFTLLIKSINIQTGTIVDLVRRNWYTEIYDGQNSYSPINGFLVDDDYYYIGAAAYSTSTYNRRLIKINRTTGEVTNTSPTSRDFYSRYGSHLSWIDDTHILTFSDRTVMIYDTEKDVWNEVDHGCGVVGFYRSAVGNKYIVFTIRPIVYVIDIETYQHVVSFASSGSTSYNSPCVTYHDGKFYIANYSSFIDVLDEETLELKRLATVSPMTNANDIKYVNGALYITQEGSDSSNKQIIYRLNEKTHSIIYTPWSVITEKDDMNSWFDTFETHGIYFHAVNTLLLSDYTGYAKYKFGKRFTRNDVSFAIDNIDNMTYDERFVTVDEAGVTVHIGDIQYELGEYNENHIASFEVNKKDYRKIIASSSMIGE